MADSGELVLRVHPGLDEGAVELAGLTGALRAELLGLDVAAVKRLPDGPVPARAEDVASVAAWLAVQLNPEALPAVLAEIADWAARNDRRVEVTYGGDTLTVNGVTRERQQEIIEDWLARYPPGA